MPKAPLSPIKIDPDYVTSFDINGLSGRRVKLPFKGPRSKARQIIIFGGFLSSAEKHFGILEYLRDFGSVTYIDLPGYGGMDSFYSIGEQPTLDRYGDYVFSILKTLKLKDRPVIVCMGPSDKIISNLLRRYPAASKSAKKIVRLSEIDANINVEGRFSKLLIKLASTKPSVNKTLNRKLVDSFNNKITPDLSDSENKLMDNLLACNDARTHFALVKEIQALEENSPSKITVDIRLDKPYKNFKLYDKGAISDLFPANFWGQVND